MKKRVAASLLLSNMVHQALEEARRGVHRNVSAHGLIEDEEADPHGRAGVPLVEVGGAVELGLQDLELGFGEGKTTVRQPQVLHGVFVEEDRVRRDAEAAVGDAAQRALYGDFAEEGPEGPV